MRRPLAVAIAATLAIGLVVAEAPPPRIVYSEEGGVAALGNGRIHAVWSQGSLPVLELREGERPFTMILSEIVEFRDLNLNGYYEESEAVLTAAPSSGNGWTKRSSGYVSPHAFALEVAGATATQELPSGASGLPARLSLGVTVADESFATSGTTLELNEAFVTITIDSWPWAAPSDVLAVRLLIAGATVEVAGREARPDSSAWPLSAYDSRAEVRGRDAALGYVRWPSSADVGTVLGPIRSVATVSVRGTGATESLPAGVEITFLFPSSYGAEWVQYSPVLGVTALDDPVPGDDPLPPTLAGLAVVGVLAAIILRRRTAGRLPAEDDES